MKIDRLPVRELVEVVQSGLRFWAHDFLLVVLYSLRLPVHPIDWLLMHLVHVTDAHRVQGDVRRLIRLAPRSGHLVNVVHHLEHLLFISLVALCCDHQLFQVTRRSLALSGHPSIRLGFDVPD